MTHAAAASLAILLPALGLVAWGITRLPQDAQWALGFVLLVALPILALAVWALTRESERHLGLRVGAFVAAPLLVVGLGHIAEGCGPATSAVEQGLLDLGEQLCQDMLTLEVPGFASGDVLACKGMESVVKGALDAVGPPGHTASPAAWGAAQPARLAQQKLYRDGKVIALVRHTPSAAVYANEWIRTHATAAAVKP